MFCGGEKAGCSDGVPVKDESCTAAAVVTVEFGLWTPFKQGSVTPRCAVLRPEKGQCFRDCNKGGAENGRGKVCVSACPCARVPVCLEYHVCLAVVVVFCCFFWCDVVQKKPTYVSLLCHRCATTVLLLRQRQRGWGLYLLTCMSTQSIPPCSTRLAERSEAVIRWYLRTQTIAVTGTMISSSSSALPAKTHAPVFFDESTRFP